MSRNVLDTHHDILFRLLNLAPISEDERRGHHAAMADARDQIDNPKTDEEVQAETEAVKDAKRKELQAQIDALNA